MRFVAAIALTLAAAASSAEADEPIPVMAVWRTAGFRRLPVPGSTEVQPGPALRYALWSDGRFLFAQDSKDWSSPLREGRLSAEAVKSVLREATATGVFDLPGNTYLVPDAPVFATLVRVEGREQILYWDEVESPRYGINIDPKPHHLAFKKAWYALNAILGRHLPKQSRPVMERFAPPRSWSIKEAVQSP